MIVQLHDCSTVRLWYWAIMQLYNCVIMCKYAIVRLGNCETEQLCNSAIEQLCICGTVLLCDSVTVWLCNHATMLLKISWNSWLGSFFKSTNFQFFRLEHSNSYNLSFLKYLKLDFSYLNIYWALFIVKQHSIMLFNIDLTLDNLRTSRPPAQLLGTTMNSCCWQSDRVTMTKK